MKENGSCLTQEERESPLSSQGEGSITTFYTCFVSYRTLEGGKSSIIMQETPVFLRFPGWQASRGLCVVFSVLRTSSRACCTGVFFLHEILAKEESSKASEDMGKVEWQKCDLSSRHRANPDPVRLKDEYIQINYLKLFGQWIVTVKNCIYYYQIIYYSCS